MQRSLPLLILIACFQMTSWAQSATDTPADVPDSTQLRADVETDMDSAASPDRIGEQFAQRVRARVRDAIIEAIEDDSDISDEQKRTVTRALRNRQTDFDSAASAFTGLSILERPDGLWVSAIAIISIVLIFGTPIMLVAAVLYAGHRKRRLASDMASRFLANGQPVPPEVWRGLSGDASPRGNLHKGMIMLGVGLGVFLCFWLIGSVKAAYLGLIPMFIGVAQLLIWKLEKQKAHDEE